MIIEHKMMKNGVYLCVLDSLGGTHESQDDAVNFDPLILSQLGSDRHTPGSFGVMW